jgi:hypothetical protein
MINEKTPHLAVVATASTVENSAGLQQNAYILIDAEPNAAEAWGTSLSFAKKVSTRRG